MAGRDPIEVKVESDFLDRSSGHWRELRKYLKKTRKSKAFMDILSRAMSQFIFTNFQRQEEASGHSWKWLADSTRRNRRLLGLPEHGPMLIRTGDLIGTATGMDFPSRRYKMGGGKRPLRVSLRGRRLVVSPDFSRGTVQGSPIFRHNPQTGKRKVVGRKHHKQLRTGPTKVKFEVHNNPTRKGPSGGIGSILRQGEMPTRQFFYIPLKRHPEIPKWLGEIFMRLAIHGANSADVRRRVQYYMSPLEHLAKGFKREASEAVKNHRATLKRLERARRSG